MTVADEVSSTQKLLDRLTGVTPKNGGGWEAICPAHADSNPSLSIDEKDGKVLVFCRSAGCSGDAIISAVGLTWSDLGGSSTPSVTVKRLAAKKKIPMEFLESLGIKDYTSSKGTSVIIPYFNRDGSPLQSESGGDLIRLRVWDDEKKREIVKATKGSKPQLYGMERLQYARASKVLLCVEGETDAITFWHSGFHAIGIPGAANHKLAANLRDDMDYLDTLFVIREPDQAGTRFADGVVTALGSCAHKIIVLNWQGETGDKDPSETFVRLGGNVGEFSRLVSRVFQSIEEDLLPGGKRVFDEATMLSLDHSVDSDIEIADNIHRILGDRYRWNITSGEWLVWNQSKSRWSPGTGHMKRTISRYMVERVNRAETTKEQVKRKHGLNDYKIASVERVLRYKHYGVAFSETSSDVTPNILLTSNGLIDLRTGKIIENRAEYMILRSARAEYHPDAACPIWDAHLLEVFKGDADLIRYFRRIVGYTLTGETSERCLFLLYGEGANGKSKTLGALKYILGDYAATIPTSYFMGEAKHGPDPTIFNLMGTRMVTASETGEKSRFNEALVKHLTGQDEVTGRGLYGEKNLSFIPNCKIWFALNHLPGVSDTTVSFWDRVRVIPFERRFEPHEWNKKLEFQLQAEASGILRWAVEGAMEYYGEGGIGTCEKVEHVVKEYRMDEDDIGSFLQNKGWTVPTDEFDDRGTWYPFATIYESYSMWAYDLKIRRLKSTKTISKTLVDKKFPRRRKSHGTEFLAIRDIPQAEGSKSILAERLGATETIEPRSLDF